MRRTCWYDSNANKGDSTLLALLIGFCHTITWEDERVEIINGSKHVDYYMISRE